MSLTGDRKRDFVPTRSGVLLLAFVAATLAGLAACTADGAAPTAQVPSGSPSTSPSEMPMQGRILYGHITGSGVAELFVATPDGSDEEPFAPGKDFEPRNVSPDGSRLAIVGPNEAGVIVGGTIAVDGSGFRLFSNPDPSMNLACGIWASERRLACEGWDDSDPSRDGIYTVRASDGGDPTRLTHDRDVPCDYSPDGTQLAFVRTAADPQLGTLMVMDAGGGNTRRLLDDVELSGIACDWSPDGSAILTGGADGHLVIVTLDGAASPFVGEGIGGVAAGGSWSPDGSHILFSMTLDDDQWDVYVAAADGSNLTRITGSELVEEAGIWLPTSVEPQSALEGTWETDTITAAEIRAVVLDAGFKREDAAGVIAGTRTFRFALTFEDGRYELSSDWDGEDVGVLEGGGYRLRADDRLLLDTGDIGDSYLFALRLQGDRFTLELIRSTESGTAEEKYTHSYFTTAFFTGHPFTRSS